MQVKQNSNYPAVFLDRDGVLIENIDGDYVRTLDQITVLPGAKNAVSRLGSRRLFACDSNKSGGGSKEIHQS